MQADGLGHARAEAGSQPLITSIFVPRVDAFIRDMFRLAVKHMTDVMEQRCHDQRVHRTATNRKRSGLQRMFELRNRFPEIRFAARREQQIENVIGQRNGVHDVLI